MNHHQASTPVEINVEINQQGSLEGATIPQAVEAIENGSFGQTIEATTTVTTTSAEASTVSNPPPVHQGLGSLTIDADLPGQYGQVGEIDANGRVVFDQSGAELGVAIPEETLRYARLLSGIEVSATVNGQSPLQFAQSTIVNGTAVNSGVTMVAQKSGGNVYYSLQAVIDPQKTQGLRVVSTDVTNLSAFADLIAGAGGVLNDDGQLVVDNAALTDIPQIKAELAKLGIVVGIVPKPDYTGHHEITLLRIEEGRGSSECNVIYVTNTEEVTTTTFIRPTYAVSSTQDLPPVVTIGPHPTWISPGTNSLIDIGDNRSVNIETGIVYAWTNQEGHEVKEPNVVGRLVFAQGLGKNTNLVLTGEYNSGNLSQLSGQLVGQALIAQRLAQVTDENGIPLLVLSASAGVRGAIRAEALGGTETQTLTVYGLNGEVIHTKIEETHLQGESFNSLDLTAALTAEFQLPRGLSAYLQGVVARNVWNSINRDHATAVGVNGGLKFSIGNRVEASLFGGAAWQIDATNRQVYVGGSVRFKNTEDAPEFDQYQTAFRQMVKDGKMVVTVPTYHLGGVERNPEDLTAGTIEASDTVALNTGVTQETVPLGQINFGTLEYLTEGGDIKVMTVLPDVDGGVDSVVVHTVAPDQYQAFKEEVDTLLEQAFAELSDTLGKARTSMHGLTDQIIAGSYANTVAKIHAGLSSISIGNSVVEAQIDYADNIPGIENMDAGRYLTVLSDQLYNASEAVIKAQHDDFMRQVTSQGLFTHEKLVAEFPSGSAGQIEIVSQYTPEGTLFAVVDNGTDGVSGGAVEPSVDYFMVPSADYQSFVEDAQNNREWLRDVLSNGRYATDLTMTPEMLQSVVLSGSSVFTQPAAGAPIYNTEGKVYLRDGNTETVNPGSNWNNELRTVDPTISGAPPIPFTVGRLTSINWADSGHLPVTPTRTSFTNQWGSSELTFTK